ncbi:Uma2 family endonuclease [Nonomuraea sp. NPDC050536]|uniref:Uma2 family endonuclease n=1 Tax=Nonomuraea sp. NPDC050536 TaxID=3364366 RepID=UPI0037CA6A8C
MAPPLVEISSDDQDDLEPRFLELCARWPDLRVEIIDSRIVVKKVPTGVHNTITYHVLVQLIPRLTELGWLAWNDITIFLGPQQDRYRPDLTVVPAEPRMWGNDHVYANETKLVVEVVSDSSRSDDNTHKPSSYAQGGVPLVLVIDTVTGKARLLSEPSPSGYVHQLEVALGGKLDLPDPWNLTIDTSPFTPSPQPDPPPPA